MSGGAGEYLPPLITELQADFSNLARGFAEATRLQRQYERDVASMTETQGRNTSSIDATAEAMVGLEHDTARSTSRQRQDHERLADGVEDSGRRMRRDYSDTGRAARAVFEDMARFEQVITRNSRNGENSLATLRREFDRLTNRSGMLRRELLGGRSARSGMAIFGDLRSTERDLRRVTGLASDLGIRLGGETSRTFMSSLASGVSALGGFLSTAIGPALTTAIAVAITVGAPVIGSALAAALTLGLGAGVIGLGAYILKDDKKLKKEATKLTKITSGVFERSAQGMKEPFMNALKDIEKEFPKLETPMKKMFDAAAPLLKPVEKGFMEMLKNMLPGITEALINAKPAFDALGKNMPLIGTAIGYFFTTISENKDDLQFFVTDGVQILAGLIMLLGDVIAWLLHAYHEMSNFATGVHTGLMAVNAVILGWYNKTIGWVFDMARAIGNALGLGIEKGVTGRVDGVAEAAGGLATAAITGAAHKLKVKSPSRVFEYLGDMTALGYLNSIEANTPRVGEAVARMVTPLGGDGGSYGSALALAQGSTSRSVVRVAASEAAIYLDGAEVGRALIPWSQQDSMRNSGISGLGNRVG